MEVQSSYSPYKHLTHHQLCERLQCSEMSVWRYRHDPKWAFPRPIKVGRRLLWRADEIEAWEEQRRVA